MRSRLAALLLVCAAAGCGPRVLVQPTYVKSATSEYIYFVEQRAPSSSKIWKCTIRPDNSAICTVQVE